MLSPAADLVVADQLAGAADADLVREEFHDRADRIERRLAEAQMEASAMARDSSSSNTSSHRSRSIGLTAFSQPTRHGVHWPQLVLEEAQQVQRHGSHVVAIGQDDHTWEPTKQPCCSSLPKSSGMSLIAAGRMPPEAPPGRYALNVWPSAMRAPELVDQLTRRDPRGRQLYSGFLTRPETE